MGANSDAAAAGAVGSDAKYGVINYYQMGADDDWYIGRSEPRLRIYGLSMYGYNAPDDANWPLCIIIIINIIHFTGTYFILFLGDKSGFLIHGVFEKNFEDVGYSAEKKSLWTSTVNYMI